MTRSRYLVVFIHANGGKRCVIEEGNYADTVLDLMEERDFVDHVRSVRRIP